MLKEGVTRIVSNGRLVWLIPWVWLFESTLNQYTVLVGGIVYLGNDHVLKGYHKIKKKKKNLTNALVKEKSCQYNLRV